MVRKIGEKGTGYQDMTAYFDTIEQPVYVHPQMTTLANAMQAVSKYRRDATAKMEEKKEVSEARPRKQVPVL